MATSWSTRSKPSTTFNERDLTSIWSSSVYPWQEALPWQMKGANYASYTERTKPNTSYTKRTKSNTSWTERTKSSTSWTERTKP